MDEFLAEVPEKEKAYPEATMFGNLPAYGFFIRHATGVNFSNVQLKTEANDDRPALYLDDVSNSEFHQMKLQNFGSSCHLLANDCSNIVVSGNKVEGTSRVFNLLKGNNNENLFITNNILLGVEKTHSPDTSNGTVIEFGNIKQFEQK